MVACLTKGKMRTGNCRCSLVSIIELKLITLSSISSIPECRYRDGVEEVAWVLVAST